MSSNGLLYDAERVFDKGAYCATTSNYGRATSFVRIVPDIFIGGVQKGGTTSLYFSLIQHPQVIRPKVKETHYYNNTSNYEQGIGWYKQFFATKLYKKHRELRVRKIVHTVDATTNNLDSREAPARILRDNPNAKVIFLLRNPVERAFSHYKMSVKRKFELASFGEALTLEEARIKEGLTHPLSDRNHNYSFQRLAYRSKGLYADHLKYWFSVFPKENIYTQCAELFFTDPATVFRSICSFLSIDENANLAFKRMNAGSSEEMDTKTCEMLREYYRPHNEELFKLLNTRYPW